MGNRRGSSEGNFFLCVNLKQNELFDLTPGKAKLLWQNYTLHLFDDQAENEELTQAVVELKKELLAVQLENTEIQERLNKIHDNTGAYSVDTENGISQPDDELVKNVDMLKKQLEA